MNVATAGGLKIDINRDLEFPVTLVSGADLVRQRLDIRFRSILDDWFLDRSFGADYFGIFQPGVRLSVVDAMCKQIISGTPGVVALTQFDLQVDPVTRRYVLAFEVQTTGGPVEASGWADEGAAFILLWG